MWYDLYKIGQTCQDYRLEIQKTQKDVARETGYSIEAISAFENGRTNNLKIFWWYIMNCFHSMDDFYEIEEFPSAWNR